MELPIKDPVRREQFSTKDMFQGPLSYTGCHNISLQREDNLSQWTNCRSQCRKFHCITISPLDIDDLGDVLDEVETLSSKWRLLSVKLRIKESSLDVIERNYPSDVRSCLYRALGEWLKLNYNHQRHGKPTWRRLAEAVKSLDCALFEDIAKRHMS